MGYASPEEILAALHQLLEAERAGARVALASKTHAQDAGLSRLMEVVHADEAHWCAMLARHIGRLGGTLSAKTGEFYGKAMKIDDLGERAAFLNRGQAWVVRKLDTLIPRVRDEMLREDLHEMAERHRTNILLAEQCLHEAGSS